MASKLPSGKYRAQVRYTGKDGKKHFASFTAKTAKEAERMAEEFKLSHAWESDVSHKTVRELVQEYITTNESVLSPSTIRGYNVILRSQLDGIGHYTLQNISNQAVQRWINSLAKTRSPKTVTNAYILFKSAINTYDPGHAFRVTLPKREGKEMIIPQKDEVDRLIQESAGTPLYLPILLAAHCGLRASEMAFLSWQDVDMSKRQIAVRGALVRGEYSYEKKTTKSAAGKRIVDMSNLIYEYLQGADRSKPPVTLKPGQITDRFSRLCKRLGYDFHIHLLRHYYCSTLALLGIPEAYAEKLSGHSSATVHRIYVHTLDAEEQKFRRMITTHFDEPSQK